MIPVNIHEWPAWILKILHIDPAEIPREAEAWISFKRFPESGWGLLAVLGLLAGFAYIIWIYRREISLTPARKAIFATLRCGVLLGIALAIFYPVLEVSVEKKQQATTLVFIDDSLSFSIADRYPSDPALRKAVAQAAGVTVEEVASLSRAQIAEKILARSEVNFLSRLASQNLLEAFTFSDSPRPVTATAPASTGEGTNTPPEEATTPGDGPGENAAEAGDPEEALPVIPAPAIRPRGPVTDLGLAVRSVVESQGSTPVAAVVLITDGKVTAGEDPAGLGLFLAERKIPAYSIGIGDPSPTRNIRVMAIFSPERAFLDDPVLVDISLDHRGFKEETVTVELLRADPDNADGSPGATEVLKTTDVTFGDTAEATARFEVLMDRLGPCRLIARVATVEGETFENDNERSIRVEVVEQATQVLLISGAPANEFRILKNLLRRDLRVRLASWLMSADPDSPQEGNIILDKLPSKARELFDYDVIILIDPDPEGFPPGYGELLDRFVGKHRGGLAYVAGEKYTARFLGSSSMKPVRELLAVEPDMSAVQDEFGRGRFHTREWPIVPTAEALSHPATRLSSHPDKNRERWASLTGLFWSLPVKRAKPAAAVLLEHPNPRFTINNVRRPLLAYQFYEGGRSLFLGIDETWRWRSVSENIYDQFWMQLIRSLTEGRLLGDRRQLILTDRDSYDLGEVIRISALVQDEDYQPSTADSIEVEVSTAEDVQKVNLEKDPVQAGWFRGVFMPAGIGTQRLRIPGGAEKTVSVEVPDLEFQDPRLDSTVLADLARLTGGKLVPIENFAELPEMIPDSSQTVVKTDEPRPLWDSALTLALVVTLLTAEWILRKWNRLP